MKIDLQAFVTDFLAAWEEEDDGGLHIDVVPPK